MKLAVESAIIAAAACLLPLPVTAQVNPEENADIVEFPADLAIGDSMLLSAEEERILTVVEAFMTGLGAKDAEAMTATALDTAFLAFVRPDEDGDAARTMPLARAITSLAETVPDIAEPIRDPRVMSDGTVAMVWAPYDFFVDGVRNHCGVNVFSLVNRDGDWLIASVVYSYLPDDCPEMAEAVADEAEARPVDPGVITAGPSDEDGGNGAGDGAQ